MYPRETKHRSLNLSKKTIPTQSETSTNTNGDISSEASLDTYFRRYTQQIIPNERMYTYVDTGRYTESPSTSTVPDTRGGVQGAGRQAEAYYQVEERPFISQADSAATSVPIGGVVWSGPNGLVGLETFTPRQSRS